MSANNDQTSMIRDLYTHQGLTAKEIGARLELTAWQVYRVMKKIGLARRTYKQTQALLFSRKPLSYRLKSSLSAEEKTLLQAGLFLY